MRDVLTVRPHLAQLCPPPRYCAAAANERPGTQVASQTHAPRTCDGGSIKSAQLPATSVRLPRAQ
eukprot:2642569-Prymnesium_polylepis.1